MNRLTAWTVLRRSPLLSAVVVMALLACGGVGNGEPGADMKTPGPIFDGFDGAAGSRPNSHFWNYEYGHPGAANNEMQTYTDSPENIHLDGSGNLVIQAQRTANGYTSGRLNTRGKVDMPYGTTSARIKFPSGKGIWPAFWLLGSNFDTVGWPECGEVDIMELVNTGTTYHVSLQGPPPNSDFSHRDAVTAKGEIADLTTDFHEYWVDRRPNRITIGVDGTTLAVFTPASLPSYAKWVFEQPMFAVLNVAVGGDWPGAPDDSTSFPATMLVDWFRYTP